MGINTKRIYAWAMAIAGDGGIAGVLVGMTFTFYPHTGGLLIIAFGVVIVGGWEA